MSCLIQLIFYYLFVSLVLMAGAFAEPSLNEDGIFNFNSPIPAPPHSDICGDCIERVNHALNFSIPQHSPRFSDLFDEDDNSQLCFPTSLAESLAYLYHYHKPQFSKLRLVGLSKDGSTLDGISLVRSLVIPCHTDRNKGTQPVEALTCTLQTLRSSGYGIGDSGLLTWRSFLNPTSVPIEQRALSGDDIRKYVRRGDAVLLHVGWYVQDTDNSWRRRGGHFIGVYGYDYRQRNHVSDLILKVMDPRTHYDKSGEFLGFSNLHLVRISSQDLESLPSPLATLTLTGPGFDGSKFPIIESILHFAPESK